MPYKIDPKNKKCVVKADSGKRVGCTKGSVKKYLAALYANVKDVNESEEFDWVDIENNLKGTHFVFNPPLRTHRDYQNFLKFLIETDPTIRYTGYLEGYGYIKDTTSIPHDELDDYMPYPKSNAFIDFDN